VAGQKEIAKQHTRLAHELGSFVPFASTQKKGKSSLRSCGGVGIKLKLSLGFSVSFRFGAVRGIHE
jgi:hypothetical protein